MRVLKSLVHESSHKRVGDFFHSLVTDFYILRMPVQVQLQLSRVGHRSKGPSMWILRVLGGVGPGLGLGLGLAVDLRALFSAWVPQREP